MKKNNYREAILSAKKFLKQGNLVVVPSDTVYGLAADARSPIAVRKVLDFKGRRFGKGISVFLKAPNQINQYTRYDKNQEKIIKTLLPGPFTVVLKSKQHLASELEPGDHTLGVRIIDYPFINDLLNAFDFPVTATSANLAGRRPHYSISSLVKTLSERKKQMLSLVIDAGQLPRRPPSTVVRLVKEEIKILRGGLFNPRLILKQQSKSEAETRRLAKEVYFRTFKKYLQEKAVVVILQGDLGTGKTVFAKGIGEIFKLQFTSPTFILLDEYRVGQESLDTIYHIDLFRLETEAEILSLKLGSLLKAGNLLLIEWGDKLATLQKLKNENSLFFWLQIKEKSSKVREFELYKL